MAQGLGKQSKKETLKNIIRELHAGLAPEKAAERVLAEAGYLTSAEIAQIEEELLNEGIPPEEIQKFCNVHALIFEKAIKESAPESAGARPVNLFKAENERIREMVTKLRGHIEKIKTKADLKQAGRLLSSFSFVLQHYVKKEQALFPLLEKRGFSGPSKVMWGKHDEIRDWLKTARSTLSGSMDIEEFPQLKNKTIDPLLQEIEGMIDKEEIILYPTSQEKLSESDWQEVKNAFIELDREAVKKEFIQEPAVTGTHEAQKSHDSAEVMFPSGMLSVPELTSILNALPVDVSFVDVNDKVKYFSEPKERIFPRTRSVIGRAVRNCHPPKSVHVVEKILDAFKTGKKNSVDFWISMQGNMVLIRYLAIRDEAGKYLGTLEVSQNISPLRALQGEKRLLDEKEL